MHALYAIDKLGNQIQLGISPDPLGKGGEGTIFKVISPTTYSHCCLKVYSESYQTYDRYHKIKYMLLKKPDPHILQQSQLCWPIAEAQSEKGFIGFLMPMAFAGSVELYHFIKLKRSHHLTSQWDKFFDNSPESCDLRLKLCLNVCIAVQMLHRKDKYAFVDLKPQNIMTNLQGKVSIVDIDSIQIQRKTGRGFYARVNTAEYTPPEGMKIRVKENIVSLEWDRFSLAVILYQLMFGIHPYMASFKAPYEQLTALYDYIAEDLFVHGRHAPLIKSCPSLHNRFFRLHPEIKALFMQAFSSPLDRPSAQLWGETLFKHISNNSHELKFI